MASGGMSLEQQFVLFSKFGDEKSDGKTITLTQSDKWMRQAEILDEKNVTLTDTGVCFNKFKSHRINCKTYVLFLEELAHRKGMTTQELKDKLTSCGIPGAPPPKNQ